MYMNILDIGYLGSSKKDFRIWFGDTESETVSYVKPDIHQHSLAVLPNITAHDDCFEIIWVDSSFKTKQNK